MGQGFGSAALWVEVWICGSADGLLRQCWICLCWGLAGFALSCIFGCGGCGGGFWLLVEGC